MKNTLITTHENADFDGFSAMLAAHKLYKNSIMLFPGSQEESLQTFFNQTACYLFDFYLVRDIDFTQIKTLVIVDTKDKTRLKHVQNLLNNEKICLHIYDHHQKTQTDISRGTQINLNYGSASTILAEKLFDNNIQLNPEEATCIALGIYTDTGKFSYPSTTEKDFQMCAWLRAKGMCVESINTILEEKTDSTKISILNDLLEHSQNYNINGLKIVISKLHFPQYVHNLSPLAEQIIKIQKADVLFIIAQLKASIQIIARSNNKNINVGNLCKLFGGGGHSYAASASVKNMTSIEIANIILARLHALIDTSTIASTIMSSPPIVIDNQTILEKAAAEMLRFSIKSLPIVDYKTKHCVGILEHFIAERGVAHGLGQQLASEYMKPEIISVSPNSSFDEILEIIIDKNQRLVPVINTKQEIVGIITRTDIVHILVNKSAQISENLPATKKLNILHHINARLSSEIKELLTICGEFGDATETNIFCVGGFVRDILLENPSTDIDLVVEKDAIVFARKLAQKLGGRYKAHPKFKTAVVILPNTQKIDIATARLEYYLSPATMPIIEISSIKMDLYRRDFSINTLAIALNKNNFGDLIDFFGGMEDLKNKIIRVLHSLSFIEDPTRIIRAIRFEQRFNFKLCQQTEKLLKNALSLDMLKKLNRLRLMHEFELICNTGNVRQCFQRMVELGIWSNICPNLPINPHTYENLDSIEEILTWFNLSYLENYKVEPWILYFLELCGKKSVTELPNLFQNFELNPKQLKHLHKVYKALPNTRFSLRKWLKSDKKNSDLFKLINKVPVETILFIMAKSDNDILKKAISRYFNILINLKISVSGKDLIQRGIAPSENYANILKTIHNAILNNEVTDRVSQLALLEQEITKEITPKLASK